MHSVRYTEGTAAEAAYKEGSVGWKIRALTKQHRKENVD